ncbi:MAG: hypothetical protein KKH33_17205 [Alphaproteobacteria bacterium]|nr:hypothetical protein [Alphaproteobacteria bacterium]
MKTSTGSLPEDQADELLAIINMIGFTIGAARELGVEDGVDELEAARVKLVAQWREIGLPDLSRDDLRRLARTAAGRC